MANVEAELDRLRKDMGRVFESQILLHESVSGMKAAYDQRLLDLEEKHTALLDSHLQTEDELRALTGDVRKLAQAVNVLVEQLGGRGRTN